MQRDRRLLVASIAAAAIAVVGAATVIVHGKLAERRAAATWNELKGYCTECHSSAEQAGGVVFEGVAASAVPQHAEQFEAAVRKLRGRLMPPPGNPQPDASLIDGFIAFAEATIDSASRDAPHAGHVAAQRLNRTEYAASVKALLGVDIDPEEYLPTEIEVDGFENIAAALSVSPAFLEQYLGVARAVARLAVGEPTPKLASVYFPPPADTDQDDYVDGMPLGTRGGTKYKHSFPADGEYHITLTDLDVGLYPRSLETEHTVVMLVDRTEVFRAKLGGAADLSLVDRGGAPGRAELMQRFASIPVRITAGVHEIAVTFIERARAATDEPVGGFVQYGGFSFRGEMRVPRLIGGIEVKGPFEPTGVSRTASRQKIFICTPETSADERGCAERIAANLARRAFRRPVSDEDVERLMPFYENGRKGPGGFDTGVEQLITAVLASPDFLYRAVVPPSGAPAAAPYALTDLELASRLSFFLWSQGPDDELLDLAGAGKLSDTDVLQEQARRMLADSRSSSLVTNFALAWLNLDELESVDPDERLFPGFSDELREDLATEIELFLRSVLLEDRNVQELLTSDETFLNERLARHYGMSTVHGPQFRRVTLDDPVRFGLLGKGAMLLRTSYGDRTSPVLRGAWVLDKLLGTPPTPPPPNVVTDLTTPAGERPKTMRVRLEQHRTDPTCSGCHSVIDPYGLALENFSVTGEWRDVDAAAGEPIDATTVLPTGAPIEGPIELRQALLQRPDQFVQAFTQKMLMYAIGRELEYYDMPQVRAIVRAAAKQDYRVSTLVAGIVASDAFRLQAPPHDDADRSNANIVADAAPKP